MEDAETQKVKPSSSIYLPFQAFEPSDLPFDLTLIPRLRTRRLNRSRVLLQTLGETSQFADMALFGAAQPVLERRGFTPFEEFYEVLTELIGDGEFLAGLTYLLDLSLLCSSELLFRENKQPGGALGGESMTFWSGCFGRRGPRWKLLAPLGGDTFQLSG